MTGRRVRRLPRATATVDEPRLGPQRTCVGCRQHDDRSELLRVVVDPAGAPGVLVADRRRTLPGRGAWVHPDPGCLDLAERRRAFARALRQQGVVDVDDVRAAVEDAAAARDGRTASPHGTSTSESTTHRRDGSGSAADGYPMSTQR